jgi:uncharacterized protein (TIGR02246 family)
MSRSIFEAANNTWNDAFNRGDLKKLITLYAENATLSPGNGEVLVGRNEIEKLFKSFIDGGVHNHTLAVVETGGSENMIFQVARWGAQGAEANGEKPAFGGVTTSVLQKDDNGSWVAHTHIWNVSQ